MFVAWPDPYLLPDYKISPFRTEDIRKNLALPDRQDSDKYFHDRHPGFEFRYLKNGRAALNLALTELGLSQSDLVTILTTTQNRYVSSCVTGEVEKFCTWNREPVEGTRAVIVIHEFGHVYPGLRELKRRLNVPIIEDCAYSFFSGYPEGLTGNVGDFVVYSFPKMFPMQEGGLLASRYPLHTDMKDAASSRYYRNVVSYCLARQDEIGRLRRANYIYLASCFRERGCTERLPLTDHEVPGAFLFRCGGVDLDELKVHMMRHGIQCSVFYGEDGFFLPVHQALSREDLDYFIFVFDLFKRTAAA